MKIPAVILFLVSLPFLANSQTSDAPVAQDTILLNSGKIIVTQVVDTFGNTVTIIKPHSHKHKKIEIDRDGIFSIRYGRTGKEDVFYIYDTLIEHDYTEAEARKFIAGEQDAQRGFHALGVSAIAFSIGFGSGVYFGSAVSFGPPFLYAGIMTYPIVHVRHKSVRDLSNATSDPYLYGYDLVARRKRTLHAFVWGGIGLVLGIVTNLVLLNN